jgi:CheY-like chemotaxis protein
MSLNLLIVDDEGSLRDFLSIVFEEEGWNVRAAASLYEARERLHESEPDLVLCDLMMPDGGGERFARELAGLSPGLAERAIYFTGGATDPAARRFFQGLGARALHKPLDPDELAELGMRLVRG